VHAPDLVREDRFGSYPAQMVAQTPIRSVLSFGLRLRADVLGVMSLYSSRPRAFDEGAVARAALLADHAALAVEAAVHAELADQLKSALSTSRTIGAAIGVLVERHRVTPEKAFDMLRRTSQNTNRRLADLADQLVQTGDLPSLDGS
jgi:GAF domain-containing protein